jgi:hypothetical protein
MSGSAALEYGFPSTHSANAVSVAVYAILTLHSESNTFSPATKLALEGLAYFYAISIVFGRLYCGMHGFVDVLVGSVIGATISLIEFYQGPVLHAWMHESGWAAPIAAALLIIILVRVHPEPADDCPCFDDSVAFAGVMIGLEVGTWHLGHSSLATLYAGPDATFDIISIGWLKAVGRIVLGVLVIFAWREAMKPALLRFLPHLFRAIENRGLILPRRFFISANEYKAVPLRIRDDNVLPNVADFTKGVRSISGPGRGRSVSIGPQSAADAYETLAYRERRRRESMGSEAGASVRSKSSLSSLREKANGAEAADWSQASGVQSGRLAEYESLMGQGTTAVSDGEKHDDAEATLTDTEPRGDELGEKEVFSKLVKPRVRYDVEVVTKLVVYTGMSSSLPEHLIDRTTY